MSICLIPSPKSFYLHKPLFSTFYCYENNLKFFRNMFFRFAPNLLNSRFIEISTYSKHKKTFVFLFVLQRIDNDSL